MAIKRFRQVRNEADCRIGKRSQQNGHRCRVPEVGLASPVSAALGSNPRIRIPKDLPLTRLANHKAVAPEVGFVGVSRCFLVTYAERFFIGRDNFFVLCDCPNRNIQSSLLAILLSILNHTTIDGALQNVAPS
jgi:hypothetical protein